jgi:hypothetical protein
MTAATKVVSFEMMIIKTIYNYFTWIHPELTMTLKIASEVSFFTSG